MKANFNLLKYQAPMIGAITKVLFKAITPKKDIIEGTLKKTLHNVVPNIKVVKEYHEWLGAKSKYDNTIAPHLFPLWSFPQLFKLGRVLNLPLHKVLNQGCKMVINNPLPINTPLNVDLDIYKVQNMSSKYRMAQRITTGTTEVPNALIAEIYAVILKGSKKTFAKEKESKVYNTENLTLVSSRYISKQDAQSYACLSGDVNPIHLSKRLAKLMGLKGSIMHGAGLFGLVYEALLAKDLKIKEIDIRFLSPVYLESSIHIYIGKSSGEKWSVKVLSDDHKSVHISGDFLISL
jgi:acyl dehydratase